MTKEKRRSQREIRKPKQEKTAPKPLSPFGSQIGVAANTDSKRAKGKAR